MIVFEWFYENNSFFEELLKSEQGNEYEVHTSISGFKSLAML